MILRILFCFQCCLCISQTKAADQPADSLGIIIKSSEPYVKKIKAYISFGEKIGGQDFDAVISTGNKGIQLARKNGDSVSVGVLKRQIGEAYYFKGSYGAAATFFYESVAVLEKTNEKASLASSYNALAKLYRKTKDLPRSFENYDKALIIFQALNDSSGIAMIYNESGVVFEYAGQYDKAVERYRASLKIDERLNDQIGISYALSNLAGVYTMQNKFSEAEAYLKQSLAVRKAIKDNFQLALNFSDLGGNYLSAENFGKAKTYIDSSNMIADAMSYPELKSRNYEMLAKVAEKQGDFKTALQYNQKKSALSDSLFNIEKSKQIEELNTRYETVKKENKIKAQQNEITLRNILMGAGMILVILGILLGYTQYRRYKWRQEAEMQANILRQQEMAATAVLEAEEAERSRIATDLHDGVGQIMSAAKMNLSAYEQNLTFKNSSEKESFEKIISLIDTGCKEIRSVSHSMMPNALLKNSLAAAIREFTDNLDHNSLKVHLYTEGFDESFNSNIETVLYRVIQECVNNVIKHSGASVLDISLVKEDKEITATIEDNGKGFDSSANEKKEGIGLKNIRTRIEYLKGTVDFKSKPGEGTLVALHIPL